MIYPQERQKTPQELEREDIVQTRSLFREGFAKLLAGRGETLNDLAEGLCLEWGISVSGARQAINNIKNGSYFPFTPTQIDRIPDLLKSLKVDKEDPFVSALDERLHGFKDRYESSPALPSPRKRVERGKLIGDALYKTHQYLTHKIENAVRTKVQVYLDNASEVRDSDFEVRPINEQTQILGELEKLLGTIEKCRKGPRLFELLREYGEYSPRKKE